MKYLSLLLILISSQAFAGSIFYVVPNMTVGTGGTITCNIRECTWTSTADGAPTCANISVSPGAAGTRTTSTGTSFKVGYGSCQITAVGTSGSFAQTNATGANCTDGSYNSSAIFMSSGCGGAWTSGGWTNITGTVTPPLNGTSFFDINGGRPY